MAHVSLLEGFHYTRVTYIRIPEPEPIRMTHGSCHFSVFLFHVDRNVEVQLIPFNETTDQQVGIPGGGGGGGFPWGFWIFRMGSLKCGRENSNLGCQQQIVGFLRGGVFKGRG